MAGIESAVECLRSALGSRAKATAGKPLEMRGGEC
jgi:hypothetical protein